MWKHVVLLLFFFKYYLISRIVNRSSRRPSCSLLLLRFSLWLQSLRLAAIFQLVKLFLKYFIANTGSVSSGLKGKICIGPITLFSLPVWPFRFSSIFCVQFISHYINVNNIHTIISCYCKVFISLNHLLQSYLEIES